MNPMDMMKNFQNIQSRVKEMQEKMKYLTVTGSSGGDMVRIELNGQMLVQKVEISPEVVDPDDILMLEDLIKAAFTDGMAKMKDKIQEEMESVTGGVIPPGFLGI